jgi:type II secretory pathway pseudopilin PulG
MNQVTPSRQFGKQHRRRANREAGSMLLILLIFLAIFIIAMSAAAPKLAQQVKRDREIEMVHRGEQYARAVKRFVKKTGQYPVRVEQLENTNNIRFIRKRYKDPMATTPEGEWKLVRQTDIQLLQGALGTGSGDAGTTGGNSIPGASPAGGTPGTNSNPGLGSNTGGSGTPSSSSGNSIFGGGQTFGGGPFIGVASTSEKTGIHEYNNKKKYNQWLFVYDQTQDIASACSTCVGVIIKGPYNPKKTVGASGIPGAQPAGGFPTNSQPSMPNIPGSPLNNPQQPQQQAPNR